MLGPFDYCVAITITCGFRPTYDRLRARGLEVHAEPQGDADTTIIFLPRSRAVAYARIAASLDAMSPGGWLVIDGAKTDGIDTILKAVNAVLPLAGRVSRDHGKTGWVQRPDDVPAAILDWAKQVSPVKIPTGLTSAPGMFSAGAIDGGSAVLLDALPTQLSGVVADFGAGWGVLSHHILAHCPDVTSLDAIEADYASSQAARENIPNPRACIHWADVATWSGGPYDTIVMNPPFHTSRKGDPAIGVAFIAAAARSLKPSGALYMVANRHLPYEQALEAHFQERVELGSDPRYKVYRARRPSAGQKKRRT